MTNKNKKDIPTPPVEMSIPLVTLGVGDTTTASVKHSIVGKEISINLKVATYFGVGNIWLTPENYWATVPDNLTSSEYDIIRKSLAAGSIVVGRQFIPPVDKASDVREKYWLMIDRTGFETKSAKKAFHDLLLKGIDDGWTAIEIANFCLDKENNTRRRKDVVRILTTMINNYDGPVSLYTPPDETEGLKKVTIKTDGTIVGETNSGKKVAKPMVSAPPTNHVRGNKSAEQAINDLIK